MQKLPGLADSILEMMGPMANLCKGQSVPNFHVEGL